MNADKRWVMVGAFTAAAVVAMSSLAGAHGGDTSQVHACVTPSGYLRIVDADGSCKTGEVALDWKVDVGSELAQFKDELRNAAADDVAVNEGTDPVSWFKTRDVPSEIADGDDDVDGGRAADLDCAACVSGSEIVPEGVTNAALRTAGSDGVGGAVTTATINNGAITTEKLANLAVTAAKLEGSDLDDALPGRPRAVTSRALSDGAVTARTISLGAIIPSKLDPAFLGSLAKVEDLTTETHARRTFDASLLDDDAASRDVNDGDGLVSWWNLEDVPDAVVSRQASDLACSICVSTDEIESLEAEKLTGTLSGSRLSDRSVTAAQLADGEISLAKLSIDVLAKFEALEDDVSALQLRLARLASPAADGNDLDRVHSTRIVGGAPGVTSHTMAVPMAGPSLSLAPATRQTLRFSGVTGAQPGDGVSVAPPELPGNLIYAGARVTDVGEVTMYLYNPDATAVDLLPTHMFELFVTDLTS